MFEVDEIAKFAIEHGGGLYSNLNLGTLREYIKRHLEYKTIIVLRDADGVAAVCRWNVLSDGQTAHVLDLIVRKDRRQSGLIKKILIYGLGMYPEVKAIKWERLLKYPSKKQTRFLVSDLLKRRK